MPASYTVEIEGLDEALAGLKAYDAISTKHFKRAMSQSVITIESAAKPLTPVFQGRLRNSIGSKVTVLGPGSIIGRVGSSMTEEEYPAVMEFGRRPGSTPPPSSALERWVQIKMGVPANKAPGVAYVVARNIGRRGIKCKRFMRQGWEKSRAKVNGYFAKALDEITKEMAGGGNGLG